MQQVEKWQRASDAVSRSAVLFLLAGTFLVPAASAASQSGTVTGRVHRSDSKQPIEGAAVRVERAGEADKALPEKSKVVAEAKSDATGRFTFTVPAGSYRIGVRAVFKNDAEAPCPVPATGLSLFPEANTEGWSVRLIRSNVGVIESVDTPVFSVAAGQELTKNIDLTCK